MINVQFRAYELKRWWLVVEVKLSYSKTRFLMIIFEIIPKILKMFSNKIKVINAMQTITP